MSLEKKEIRSIFIVKLNQKVVSLKFLVICDVQTNYEQKQTIS